jgi:hypothetical protein
MEYRAVIHGVSACTSDAWMDSIMIHSMKTCGPGLETCTGHSLGMTAGTGNPIRPHTLLQQHTRPRRCRREPHSWQAHVKCLYDNDMHGNLPG